MAERYFLDMEDVLELHRVQLARFGGAVGIRDAGLIEAVLARPQSGYYGDLIEEAAALWESLTMNHGLVDGNKRVGFAAVYVFLRVNGVTIKADADVALRFILDALESGAFRKEVLQTWLRENTG